MHTESSSSGTRDRFVGSAGHDFISSLVQQRRIREMSRAMTGEGEARVPVRAGEEGRSSGLFKDLCDRLKRVLSEGHEPHDRGGCCAIVNGWIIAGTVPGWYPS
jgi:hypothetical protein